MPANFHRNDDGTAALKTESAAEAKDAFCPGGEGAVHETITANGPSAINMKSHALARRTFKNLPTREDVINKTYTEEQVKALDRLFGDHGMDLLSPPLVEVDEDASTN